jgi:hypothetical protein
MNHRVVHVSSSFCNQASGLHDMGISQKRIKAFNYASFSGVAFALTGYVSDGGQCAGAIRTSRTGKYRWEVQPCFATVDFPADAFELHVSFVEVT